MSVLSHNILIGASGARDYEIANSLRCNDDDSAYLSRTPASAGNRKTWTWARWVKRANLGSTQYLSHCYDGASNQRAEIKFQADDTLRVYTGGNTAGNGNVYTTAKFRDVGAYYHVMVRMDTTLATAADRIRIYVNGVLQAITIDDQCTQNFEGLFNTTNAHHIAGQASSATFDGYLADDIWVDGQSLDPSNFGETGTYGEFKPIQYTGTYGTNGHNLDFEASGDLGNDVSGNGNDWTPTNLAATDQMLDTPTNNFCTLNALIEHSAIDFEEGNTKMKHTSTSDVFVGGTIGVDSGKWYWEYTISTFTSSADFNFGVGLATKGTNTWDSSVIVNFNGDGTVRRYGTSLGAVGTTFAAGDVLGVAYDAGNQQYTFYKNNTSIYTVTGLNNEAHVPFCSSYSTNAAIVFNAGQDSSFAGNKTAQGNTDDNGIGDFFYSPPSGYLSLCSKNLPEATVVPSEHFNTVLYSGNSSTQSITAVGFQPDLSWLKARNITYQHHLFDVIRGANERLYSSLTNAEETDTDSLNSFDSDGFSLGAEAGTNETGRTYVAWNWKANGAGVSNTDGSITSTVSANTDAGFSIVGYTATGTAGTVGHGLSKALEMIIVKHRDQALTGWPVYHKDNTAAPETDYLRLHGTNATSDDANAWNDTAPTSSVFSIGNNGGDTNNTSGGNTIAYCFHSVAGMSKVFSYTGNGSSDGPMVFCDFEPAFILIKRTDSAASWVMLDSDRDIDNAVRQYLYADASSAEAGSFDILDILSNGFKIRDAWTQVNVSGGNYIGIAIAKSPLKHGNAR